MGKKKKEKLVIPENMKRMGFTEDSYQNIAANLGAGSNNISEQGRYVLTRFTWDYATLNALYRNNWIAKGIIDKPANEMLKSGFEIQSEVKPSLLKKVEVAFERTKSKEKFIEAIKWSRLYGGCVIIPLIEGQEKLEKPLEFEKIMPGTYKGCMVADRWSGVSPSTELVQDIDSPEFGLPEFYMVSDGVMNKTYKVHYTRIIRLTARELPFWEKIAEMHWGASELEHVFTELRKRDDTSANIAFLIFLANVRVFKMKDLGQAITLGDQEALNTLYKTMQSQNSLMANTGSLALDNDDDFQMQSYTFSGINDIYESFMLDIAGASEIPVTKLFGRSPAGMNSSGESELQNYYDMIQEKQEAIKYPLTKLLKIITMSEIGKIPDDFELVFNPVRRPGDLEKSDLASKNAQPIFDAFAAGLIDKATALKELQQQQKQTSLWSNITDEIIETARKEAEEAAKEDEDVQNSLEDEAEKVAPTKNKQGDKNDGPKNEKKELQSSN